MTRISLRSKMSGKVSHWLTASSLGLLLVVSLFLSACSGNNAGTSAHKENTTLQIDVVQIDSLAKLGDKVPDGQYMVVKTTIKNLSNQSMTLNPTDFALENITKDEKERYSQPAEKFLTFAFIKDYGQDSKDKLVDTTPMSLYPRLQLERYFVFMVPADVKPNQYQLTYKPINVTTPLVSGNTIINDHRNDSAVSGEPH